MNPEKDHIIEANSHEPKENAGHEPQKRRPFWRKALKWVCATAIIATALITLLLGVVLFYLTPERLTPLVNKYAGNYLDADVHAARVELTFWSTFPRLEVEIDTLTIVSRSLKALPAQQRAELPQDADSLLSLQKFSGGIHLLNIIAGNIDLYNVQLTNPRINLYTVNDSINNFDILPPSEPSSEPAPLPEISIDRFAINGQMPVRFRSQADSIDFTLTLQRTNIEGTEAPTYTIGIAGNTSARMASLEIPSVPFSIDGRIDWDADKPEELGLHDFRFSAMNIPVDFSAQIAMADTLAVNSMELSIPEMRVGELVKLVPEEYIGHAKRLNTDLTLALEAKLLHPYRPTVDKIPSLETRLTGNASKLELDELNIHSIKLDLRANIDGFDLNRSVINLRRLSVAGHAMDFTLKADVKSPVNNPDVNATFTGGLSLNKLPKRLLSQMPMTISGTIKGNASAHFRLNDLKPKRFHRTRIDGRLTLSKFSMAMRDGSMDAYLNIADMRLGTSSRVTFKEHLIDSLLTASLAIDTASVNAPGIQLAGRGMAMNVGMRNVASSSDTTQINPIGISLRAGLLTLKADSGATRIRLRDAAVGGALRRYNSEARSPQLDLKVTAKRIGYVTPELRANLRESNASLTLHPRAKRPMQPRMQARIDSLAAVYPELSTDSLTALARRTMPRKQHIDNGRQNIDFKIDNSLASWLRLWQLNGKLAAKRARVYTPYYPVKNVMKDIDLAFNTDSINFHHAYLKSGLSDFTLNGSIKNIRRAMTSHGRVPIEIDLYLRSDTIDVNDITATMLRGAAYSGEIDSLTLAELGDLEKDDDFMQAGEPMADSAMAALIIPSNVKASLSMKADRIHYGDLWFRNFTGNVSIYDGAVALERLSASTDIGRLNMTALYSAPTANDIQFAAGVNMKKLNLRKILLELPQIDTIMPMLKEVSGIVDANLAITTKLDSLMNIRFNTLDMSLQLAGDSLVLLDSETFRTVAKWMLFKNKKRNMIDHMDVEITVREGWLDLYPVIFDMDRYRIGIVGNNDMNFNLDYHVAVLKSPIPFKFGINIKGTPEKMKIRLGKARINEKTVATSRHLTDSLRVNLIQEISKTFRRGVRTAGKRGLQMQEAAARQRQSAGVKPDDTSDVLNAADSAIFIKEGLMEPPPGFVMPGTEDENAGAQSKNNKKKTRRND